VNDPYEVLGSHPNAAPQVLRAAYMGLAHANHQDKGGSAERMATITEAWAAVGDVRVRRKTDEGLQMRRKLERPACVKCRGKGLVTTSKGFVSGPEVVCGVCKGSGLPVGKVV
jgi:DnaJ-class molecular chaperone